MPTLEKETKAGRKPIAERFRRPKMSVSVAPETKRFLDRKSVRGMNPGKIIDELVKNLSA